MLAAGRLYVHILPAALNNVLEVAVFSANLGRKASNAEFIRINAKGQEPNHRE
jgi:hypothetical protein